MTDTLLLETEIYGRTALAAKLAHALGVPAGASLAPLIDELQARDAALAAARATIARLEDEADEARRRAIISDGVRPGVWAF